MTTYLSIINPEDIPTEEIIEADGFKNILFDNLSSINYSSYISTPETDKNEDDNLKEFMQDINLQPKYYTVNKKEHITSNLTINGVDLGDGNFDYLCNNHIKLMFKNAWQAITETNLWNFMLEDIDAFMWLNDSRVAIISDKMCELGYTEHSGCSFSYTMQNMQFLAQKGETKFKQMFLENYKYKYEV